MMGNGAGKLWIDIDSHWLAEEFRQMDLAALATEASCLKPIWRLFVSSKMLSCTEHWMGH